ncbi:alkaline phosphatase [Mesobacillus selenatarsenatis]|uniref:Alkaline phosphatase n=1 Tax=Mesobacillus selenatarsenatis (strain DSM 18680 / JCM 14380 / FERM P-15431 / SF-1) TaxID=1321606 RepID=A0A0A8X9S3_MESS1|nr:alkaline phosphatase [Mesobacillus selenatarsenatis]GAM16715.1 alkaline phosphatase [Mesobacillus selenatarsenatis SF-1]
MSLKTKLLAVTLTGTLAAGGFAGINSLTENNSQVAAKADVSKENVSQKPPKNVIVMVGDGMGIGQLEVARLMEYGKEGRLNMESLENVALMHTYSADNTVTDSGAAGTAIATGSKTNNESIGVDENGNEVKSMLDAFQARGKKVGVISNNTVTDATPAAFTASVPNRWSGQAEVAKQMLENEYDVLLGGGATYFEPKRHDGVDLVEKFEEKGYTYVTDRDELNKAGTPDKLLGLFHSSYMNYKTDKDDVNSNEPTLNEMTKKAIDVLSNGKDGFFLMVEGARIDHASHAADFTGIWKETIEFDNTVKDVVQWAKNRNDTLVVVLADHETMGVSATETMDIEGLKAIDVSPEFMAGKLVIEDGTATAESVKSVFKEYANIELTNEEVAEFQDNIKDAEGKVYAAYRTGWEIGSVIAKYNKVGVVDRAVREESTTGGHTGNMVPVFATGTGSERFEGVLDNTEVIKLIAEAARQEYAHPAGK